jgi:hypothetical protein
MYCVIKCVKSTRVLKGKFASSVFHGCKEKTPKTRILVSGPQCVKWTWAVLFDSILYTGRQSGCVSLTSVSTRHSLTPNTKEYVKVLSSTKVSDIRNVHASPPCHSGWAPKQKSIWVTIGGPNSCRAKNVLHLQCQLKMYSEIMTVLGSILNTG